MQNSSQKVSVDPGLIFRIPCPKKLNNESPGNPFPYLTATYMNNCI